MKVRQLPLNDYLAIKAAIRRLVKDAGGSESAASISRITRRQTFSEAGSPHEEHTFLAIDVIADLEAEAGIPHVTKTLAHLSDHLLVPTPHHNSLFGDVRGFGRVVAACGKAIEEHGKALEDDGKISSQEARELIKHITEAQSVIASLRVYLETIQNGDNQNG